MTYSRGQRELHCARVTIFLCAPTFCILFFRHMFWKKWPWIISSFLLPLRMIHCLLSLQLNPTLEYQKVKITLFSNKVIYLERTRITSLAKPGIWCFQVLQTSNFHICSEGKQLPLRSDMTPDCLSYLSSHHTVQFSSSTIHFSQAQSPSEPQWPEHHYQTIISSQSPPDTLQQKLKHTIISYFPFLKALTQSAAAAVQSFLTLGSLFSVLASLVKF